MKSRGKKILAGFFLLSMVTGPGFSDDAVNRVPNFFSSIIAAGETREPDVHYVPTPTDVVAKMLDMADVGGDDIVYDLGCGDGRIVISAARERGARGIGIDIDPARIAESRENAEKAGVTDRVEFLEQDLFTTDLGDATVVTLYLLPSLNLKLLPKLIEELKPGTRIVSHSFSMGDWDPDESAMVDGHHVYFWVIPSNVSGSWEWTASGQEGEEQCRLDLTQSFQQVEGTLKINGRTVPVQEARLKGNRLEFGADRDIEGRETPVQYKCTVNNDVMKGRCLENGRKAGSEWTAKRDPSTVKPLYEITEEEDTFITSY